MPTGSSRRFQILLDLARRGIFLRDETVVVIAAVGRRMLPRHSWRRLEVPEIGTPVRIPVAERGLQGWFVKPEEPAKATVLLFHGIGDRIEYWRRLQQRLAAAGLSSLVFHYAGYGESEGQTTPENLALDASAAYAWLLERQPSIPCFLLAFSLGTGLAAEVAASLQPPPAGLILCEAYPTLRRAAMRVVRPAPFAARLLPDVWRTVDNVCTLRMPLLVVHSAADTLFPAAMAEEIHASSIAAGVQAELKIFPDYAHNAPYYLVPEDYWASVVEFITRPRPG